jgi:tetrahydromethanopterin S-methyltransferase subunit F
MAGFYLFCRWLTTGINPDFGAGVAVGAVFVVVLVNLAKWLDPNLRLI